eukprot:CAMPEP_0206479738 /NCGR_PEP_ID=MMETSP0324_2-20121206/36848_1 /ASSEMBLY_ACC=CAM_ASM_000836 /TAXON_ID=2866 /ORGANISM="Crypthecodinium cohnii, Strain Seligo" /LENGTH=70 /DNA_ID=CAMNT_0053956333 /DNA_START=438 /DNA_END=647 /DNA_ORIENTATION=-
MLGNLLGADSREASQRDAGVLHQHGAVGPRDQVYKTQGQPGGISVHHLGADLDADLPNAPRGVVVNRRRS